MRKFIAAGLAIVMFIANMNITGLTAYADTTAESDFVYSLSADPTTGQDHIITEYTGESKIINIPDTINGNPVKAIGEGVFRDKDIVEVNIPEGITYIGKEAFKGNKLTEINIPDSVTTIKEGAFQNANNNPAYSASVRVTGMKGVTRLEDASFAEMHNLRMDIPSVDELNQNAFQPTPSGWSRSYILLYTENFENKHRLESVENVYLIDPAEIIIEAMDIREGQNENSGIVIKKSRLTTRTFGTDYGYQKRVSDFYKVGDSISGYKPSEVIAGYARPLTGKDISLTEAENIVAFQYKPIWIEAPIKVTANETQISGKVTYNNATVKLYSKKGYYASQTEEGSVETTDGEFTFSNLTLDSNKTYQIEAKVKNSEYIGDSATYSIEVSSEKVEGFELPDAMDDITVKEGEEIEFPSEINLSNLDGQSYDFRVTWDNEPRKIDNAGIYWFKGKAVKYSLADELEIPVFIKIIVNANDDIAKSDKTDLIKKIEEARDLIPTAIVSEDGNDVLENALWVTQEEVDIFTAAIEKANTVVKDSTANQDKVVAAQRELSEAMSTFISAKKAGKKSAQVEIRGSIQVYVTGADINASNKDDFALKINKAGAPENQAQAANSVNATDSGIEYNFNNVAAGTWDLIAPEGYIATQGGNRAGRDVTRADITHEGHKVLKFVNFDRGLRVHYDVGEHGTAENLKDVYYINGEHWDALPLPIVTPNPGWRFIGWSDNGGVDIKLEHRAIITNENLVAIYKRSDDDGVDESTKIGGPWVLGDFVYEKDTAVGKEEEWVIKGFSSSGLQKSTKYFNLVLPHITAEGNEIKAIGMEAFESKDIESVEIPEGIERIYSNAFYQTHITRLILPNTIELVGNNAFLRCKINELVLSQNLERINDGAFAENKIRRLDLPESLVSIEASAFADNMIEEVNMKEGLNSIGVRAFYHNALKRVKIPLTLKKLDDSSFEGNPGLTNLKSKVALYTEDRTNPHNLRDGKGHVINPFIPGTENNDKKNELMDVLKRVQKLSNSCNVSENGSDIGRDEYWINETLKDKVKQALYEGYYAYYDDSAELEDTNPRYRVDNSKAELEKVEELIKADRALGTKRPDTKGEIVLTVGVEGIEYSDDLTDEHEFTLKNVDKPNSMAHRWKMVKNTAPHTAWLSWNLSDGKYKFEVPVGKVLAYQDGLNGKMKPEKNPFIRVRNQRLVQGEDTEDFGFSMEDGVVFIYDLMDGGSSEDILYETQMRGYGAVNIPRVTANAGTRLKGWSLDGENVIDITKLKAEGNQIFKAVYEEGEETVVNTKPLDDEIQVAVDVLASATVSVNGKNISSDKKWTTQEEFTKLEEAIERAKEIKKNLQNDIEVKREVDKLKRFIDEFKRTLKRGIKVEGEMDKNLLKKYMDSSEEIISSTKIAQNASSVLEGEKWIEEEYKKSLYRSLVEANFVYEDTRATNEEIVNAINSIKEKYESFIENIKVKPISDNTNSDTNSNTGSNSNSNSNSGSGKNSGRGGRGSGRRGGSGGSGGSGSAKATEKEKAAANPVSKSFEVGKDGRWIFTEDKNWYFIDSKGKVVNNSWAKIINSTDSKDANIYYYFNEKGQMQTGWLKDKSGDWYYLNKKGEGIEGRMHTGWYLDKATSKWYFLDRVSGKLIKGWKEIDGKWYYFATTSSENRPEGSLYVNEMTPDFYFVDKKGELIK